MIIGALVGAAWGGLLGWREGAHAGMGLGYLGLVGGVGLGAGIGVGIAAVGGGIAVGLTAAAVAATAAIVYFF